MTITIGGRVYAYDIETLINYFSAIFIDVVTEEEFLFELYDIGTHKKNDLEALYAFLEGNIKALVGYNNLSFDYPVIHRMLQAKKLILRSEIKHVIEFIYNRAQSIINKRVRIKEEKVKIPQIDLMALNYFDSKVKATSLKQIEFIMRFDNVQDMPYHHAKKLKTIEQIKEIGDYNRNDGRATLMFYRKNKDAIELRRKLSNQYKVNLLNHSETGLGKEAFAHVLTKTMGISRYQLNQMGTKRDKLDVGKQVILPFIKFKTPEFNNLLEFFKLQTMNKLKGFFKNIGKNRKGYDLIINNVYHEHIKKDGKISDLSVVFRDHIYVYGSGGIHSYFRGKHIVSDEEYVIYDIDVESFYPMLAIIYKFRPGHLGEIFGEIYETIFKERKLYEKGTSENKIKKIQLNSSFGLSNNEYSFLYDSLMTAQICINGQLLLTVLIEKILLDTDSECIMANTKPRHWCSKIPLIAGNWRKVS